MADGRRFDPDSAYLTCHISAGRFCENGRSDGQHAFIDIEDVSVMVPGDAIGNRSARSKQAPLARCADPFVIERFLRDLEEKSDVSLPSFLQYALFQQLCGT